MPFSVYQGYTDLGCNKISIFFDHLLVRFYTKPLLLQNFLIQGQKFLFLHAPVEFLFDRTAAVFAHLTGLVRVVQQVADRVGDFVHVGGIDADAEAVLRRHLFVI